MAIVKSGTVKYPANKAFPDQYNPGAFKQNIVITMSYLIQEFNNKQQQQRRIFFT